MSIGVSYETFRHLNPAKLKAFVEGHKIKKKMRDAEMWTMGQYIMSALDATVCNNSFWRKKGEKAHQYIDKPILQQNKNVELTEEEKRKQTENLFLRLQIMGANFKNNHKDGTVS